MMIAQIIDPKKAAAREWVLDPFGRRGLGEKDSVRIRSFGFRVNAECGNLPNPPVAQQTVGAAPGTIINAAQCPGSEGKNGLRVNFTLRTT